MAQKKKHRPTLPPNLRAPIRYAGPAITAKNRNTTAVRKAIHAVVTEQTKRLVALALAYDLQPTPETFWTRDMPTLALRLCEDYVTGFRVYGLPQVGPSKPGAKTKWTEAALTALALTAEIEKRKGRKSARQAVKALAHSHPAYSSFSWQNLESRLSNALNSRNNTLLPQIMKTISLLEAEYGKEDVARALQESANSPGGFLASFDGVGT